MPKRFQARGVLTVLLFWFSASECAVQLKRQALISAFISRKMNLLHCQKNWPDPT